MSESRPRIVDVSDGGASCAAVSFCEAAPAVVLLHGFAQTPGSWGEVAAYLREAGVEVEPLALAGAASGLGSLDALCKRVANAVEACAWGGGGPQDFNGRSPLNRPATPRPVVLVGYSMGGRVAAETLVRYPDLPVSAVVLESAGLGPQDEADRHQFAERNSAWADRLRSEGVARFMDWWEQLPLFESQRALPEDVRRRVRQERLSCGGEELAYSLEAWGAHHQALQAETLAALLAVQKEGATVVYMAGALDSKYCVVAERANQVGLTAVIVPDAGHNVHLEQPEFFADYVKGIASSL